MFARYLQGHGFPGAEPVGAGRAGSDVTGTPGLGFEVKARRDFHPTTWLKQASKTAGAIPIVVHRPDGYGPATIGDWPVMLRLADAVELLRAAGYGTPPARQIGA